MSSVKPKPSSTKVIRIRCRYCNLELVKQNYKDHIKRFHPEADQNDLRPKSQSSLLSFYNDNTTKSSACNSNETKKLNDNDDSENSNPSVILSEADFETPIASDQSGKKRKSTFEHLVSNKPSVLDSELSLKMNEKLDLILTKLDNLDINTTSSSDTENFSIIKNLECESSNHFIEQSLRTSDISEKLYKCRTIEDILGEFSEFELSADGNNFICQVCVKHPSPSDHGCGIISINSGDTLFSTAGDTDKARAQKGFRNVKKKLKRHMEGNIHIKSLEATAKEEVNNKAFVSRDHKVGETLGVLIYDITKTAKSDRAYEDQVSIYHCLG